MQRRRDQLNLDRTRVMRRQSQIAEIVLGCVLARQTALLPKIIIDLCEIVSTAIKHARIEVDMAPGPRREVGTAIDIPHVPPTASAAIIVRKLAAEVMAFANSVLCFPRTRHRPAIGWRLRASCPSAKQLVHVLKDEPPVAVLPIDEQLFRLPRHVDQPMIFLVAQPGSDQAEAML